MKKKSSSIKNYPRLEGVTLHRTKKLGKIFEIMLKLQAASAASFYIFNVRDSFSDSLFQKEDIERKKEKKITIFKGLSHQMF
jgi:hypothetical protein